MSSAGSLPVSKSAKLLSGLGAAIKSAQQDAVANQLMNSSPDFAPRAALETAGTNPATGELNVVPQDVPITGTSPLTGGVDELKARREFEKENLEQAYKGRNRERIRPGARDRALCQTRHGERRLYSVDRRNGHVDFVIVKPTMPDCSQGGG